MGAYSQQALRANTRLDNAIKKIEGILGNQRVLIQELEDYPEVLAKNTTPKLRDINDQLIRLAKVIELLKKDISNVGTQLDIEEENRIRAQIK